MIVGRDGGEALDSNGNLVPVGGGSSAVFYGPAGAQDDAFSLVAVCAAGGTAPANNQPSLSTRSARSNPLAEGAGESLFTFNKTIAYSRTATPGAGFTSGGYARSRTGVISSVGAGYATEVGGSRSLCYAPICFYETPPIGSPASIVLIPSEENLVESSSSPGVVEFPITENGRVRGTIAGAGGGAAVSGTYAGGIVQSIAFELQVLAGGSLFAVIGQAGEPASLSSFGGGGGGSSALIWRPPGATNAEALVILLSGGGSGARSSSPGGSSSPTATSMDMDGSRPDQSPSSTGAGNGGGRDLPGQSALDGGKGGEKSAFFELGDPNMTMPPLVATGNISFVQGGAAVPGAGAGGGGFTGGGGGANIPTDETAGGGGGWSPTRAFGSSAFNPLLQDPTTGSHVFTARRLDILDETGGGSSTRSDHSGGFIALSGAGIGSNAGVFITE